MPSGTSRSSPSTAVIGPKRLDHAAELDRRHRPDAFMTGVLAGRRLAPIGRLADCRRCSTSAGSGRCTSSRCAARTCTREREPHVLFQASTIGALLDGAFEGDLSFAELAEHGDLGLGTLNRLDGEMIALDGELLPRRRRRAARAGSGRRRGPRSRWSPASSRRSTASSTGRSTTTSCWPALDALVPAGASSCAIRLDGRFELGPRPLGPAPEPALPAADRGRRRPARLRARRRRGDDARLPLPRPTPRGSRSAATTCTSSAPTAAAAATSSTRARAACGRASTPPTTSTSSCRPGRARRPRPRRRDPRRDRGGRARQLSRQYDPRVIKPRSVVLVLLFAVALALQTSSAAANPVMHWSPSQQIVPGAETSFGGARDVSCADANLCVAVGREGRFLSSTEPAGASKPGRKPRSGVRNTPT